LCIGFICICFFFRGRGTARSSRTPPGSERREVQTPTVLSFPGQGQPSSDWTKLNSGGKVGGPYSSQSGEPIQEQQTQKMPQVISVTLPRFYEQNCKLWFTVAENIFKLKGIYTETQRFELVLCALDLHHLEKLEHVLDNLSDLPYSQLRGEIIQIFAPTEETNLNRLLYDVQLGEKQPTELLFEMRKLMGSQDCPILLEKLFKERLPESVRRVIVVGPPCDLDELARRADAVMKEDRNNQSSKQTLRGKPSMPAGDESRLGSLINNLTVAVNKLSSQSSIPSYLSSPHGNQPNNTNAVRPGPITSTPRFSSGARNHIFPSHQQNVYKPRFNPPPDGLCFYHRKFGDRALNCQAPCTWTRQTPAPVPCKVANEKPSFVGTVKKYSPAGLTLFFVLDPDTETQFLIDTGSEFSLLPCDRSSAHPSRTQWLVVANGEKVPAFESVQLTVSLNLNRKFTWRFLQADVRYPTIGLDFLRHFNILLDVATNTLKLNNSVDRLDCTARKVENVPCGPTPSPAKSLQELFSRYEDLFDLTNFLKPIRHQSRLHIQTTGPPYPNHRPSCLWKNATLVT